MPDDDTLSAGWFVILGDKREGPLDEGQIRSLITAGRIDGRTLVWRQGFPDWAPIYTVPLFSKDLPPLPPPPLPVSKKAHNAFVASAVIWGIQLAMYLAYGTIALPIGMALMGWEDLAAVFQVGTLIVLAISGILFVVYLLKYNIARILGIVGSVVGILRAFRGLSIGEGDEGTFIVTGSIIAILLNIAFIWLAVVAKPVFQRKHRTA